MRRTRPDFRAAAKLRLTDERGVAFAVTNLLSDDGPSPARVQVVAIDRLVPHPSIDHAGDDGVAFGEIVESIRDLGVLSPIVARPAADGSGLEILDGVRRWAAARSLGHTVAPVIVHDLDDEAARRLVDLGRRRRPIPYRRMMAWPTTERPDRVPVVVSGPVEP